MAGYDAPASLVNIAAGSAIRKGQIVKISSSAVIPCSSQGEAFFGVAIHDAASGELALVCVAGECSVEVDDATLVVGDFITTKATGVAEKAATSDVIVGMILEPGAAAVSGAFGYRRCVVRLSNEVSA